MMGVGLGPSAMHDLNLTRAQVRNITRIRKESAGEWAGTMAEMQEQHWELSRAMAEDDPDAERPDVDARRRAHERHERPRGVVTQPEPFELFDCGSLWVLDRITTHLWILSVPNPATRGGESARRSKVVGTQNLTACLLNDRTPRAITLL